MNDFLFYRISNGRIWDIEKAKFTTDFDEAKTVDLQSSGGLADEAYLRRTLEFYGYPVGDELLTDEDRAEAVRKKRDQLLSDTDYLLMPDYPLEALELEAVKTYRQALRDVPEQSGFPKTIEWPSKPEVIL